MAWVNSCATFLIPLLLSPPIVAITPIPQTPLLAVVTSSTVAIYESSSLLPLAIHKRANECLTNHKQSVSARIRHVSVDTSKLGHMHSVNLYIQTAADYILIYHLFVNYSRSLYEVTDVNNGERLLQNSKPLASDNSRFNLANFIKTATKSIIQGGSADTNLTNMEHFNNAAVDDDQRNENIPLVKLTMIKILRMNAGITGFWCKLNSQNLIFTNDCDEIQILNLKTFNNEIIKLADSKWYYDTTLIEYNLNDNYFLHLSSTGELGVLQFNQSKSSVAVDYTLLTKLDFECRHILINPQYNLVILQSDTDLKIYKVTLGAKTSTLCFIKTLYEFTNSSQLSCKWSPCGSFLIVWNMQTNYWKMISKFGFILFDSKALSEEIAAADIDSENLLRVNDFCFVSDCAIALNSQTLYILNKDSSKIYHLDLLRLLERFSNMSIFHDENYISVPVSESNSFARFPILPTFQKVLSHFQYVNGTALASSHRKPTGYFTIRVSESLQLSMSYGPHLAISTPIKLGSDFSHPLWYVFYNHFVEPLNIVNHFWVKDNLILINRYARDDVDPEEFPDMMIDELMILNTAASKYGAGGANFKFDSDSLVWRHSFRNRIVTFELIDLVDGMKTLVLITNDMRIILMELSKGERSEKPGAMKISIRVRRTIHLSSIKHKLPITLIQQMTMVDGKHFFFLLNNGDLYLLKNQITSPEDEVANQRGTTQANNMYDLIKISSAVESFQVSEINFNQQRHNRYITFFNGGEVLVYNMGELVERIYEFEGVEHSSEVDVEKPLRPIKIKIASFMPLRIYQSNGSIEVAGFEYQAMVKSDFLILKHRPSRQLILNKFIQHDLFESNLLTMEITRKFSNFGNYDYCLELLLFENLYESDEANRLRKVCQLVDATANSDSIYINFLRKIEVKYWDQFFKLLDQTPVGFMNRLRESNNVELCYNYLNIYLNFKREFESSVTPFETEEKGSILDAKDCELIKQIIKMLLEAQKWDECYELCRYIKLLQPSGNILREIRQSI